MDYPILWPFVWRKVALECQVNMSKFLISTVHNVIRISITARYRRFDVFHWENERYRERSNCNILLCIVCSIIHLQVKLFDLHFLFRSLCLHARQMTRLLDGIPYCTLSILSSSLFLCLFPNLCVRKMKFG